ncbi:MAG: energy transducer TonB [candidate division WOR-3 bacterium]
MTIKNNWDYDYYYATSFRLSLIGALLSILALFLLLPEEFATAPYRLKTNTQDIMELLPIPLNRIVEPPPAVRPKLPVAALSPNRVEANTIEPTSQIESLKKPTDTEPPTVPFAVVEEKPILQYLPTPVYPEPARLLAMEGKVVVEVLVEIDGKVIDSRIVKSSGYPLLDQAAIESAQKAIFTPAKQRDKLVRVWIAIPFEFKLSNPK